MSRFTFESKKQQDAVASALSEASYRFQECLTALDRAHETSGNSFIIGFIVAQVQNVESIINNMETEVRGEKVDTQ